MDSRISLFRLRIKAINATRSVMVKDEKLLEQFSVKTLPIKIMVGEKI